MDAPTDRAMTPEQIAQEMIPKPARWLRTHIPAACRVPVNTRPPLFWESRTRRWWETGKAS